VESILKYPKVKGDLPQKPTNTEQRKMLRAYKLLYDLIYSEFSKLSDQPNKQEEQLINIRENVKTLSVIEIIIFDEKVKYEIFESVNASGTKLEPEDLIKNLILSKNIDKKAKVLLAWESANETSSHIKLPLTNVIRYYWNSTFEFTTKSKLYEKIRTECISNNNLYKRLAQDFNKAANIFKTIQEGSSKDLRGGFIEGSNKKYTVSFSQSIEILRETKVKQFYGLFYVLYLHRDKISAANIAKLARTVAHFSFVYFSLCSQRANRVERLFSTQAINIHKAASEQEPQLRDKQTKQEIDKTIQRLREIWPTDHDIRTAISHLKYNKTSKNRSVLRALFAIIEFSNYPDKAGNFDWELINIEHIQPQNPKDKKKNKQFNNGRNLINCIGNLCLLQYRTNQKKGNLLPNDPKAMEFIESSDIKTTQELAQLMKNWGPNAITRRETEIQEASLKILCKSVN
jgi:hypothetical protein